VIIGRPLDLALGRHTTRNVPLLAAFHGPSFGVCHL
jgi:hypothetical protein